MVNKNRHSDNLLPGEEIKIIKKMIEKTKMETADSGVILIMWGWLILAACILHYILVYINYPMLSWLPWVILMPIGAIISVVCYTRQEQRSKVKSYTSQSVASLWQACGVGFLVIGFIVPAVNLEFLKTQVPMLSIIAGIGMFVTGGIFEWNIARISGVIWWIAAVVMIFLPWYYHTLILALTIIPGYLLPGYMIRREYLRQNG